MAESEAGGLGVDYDPKFESRAKLMQPKRVRLHIAGILQLSVNSITVLP